jgi:hypothetical protein
MREQTENQPPMNASQVHDSMAKDVIPTGAPLLPEDEKVRIHQEMLFREEICRELAKERSSERRRGVHPFLNSPFFLTAVCGLMATAITHVYSHTAAHNEHQEAQDRAIREKKIALVSSAANDVPTYVSIFASMLKRKLWLQENTNSDAKYDDGRSRDDVHKEYWELFEAYLHARKAISILVEVQAYFGKPVQVQVKMEKDSIDAIETAPKSKDVIPLVKSEEPKFEELLRAMVAEIKLPNRHE